MGCKIIFAPQAIADLAEAVRHLAKHDPKTAERIGHALVDREFALLGVFGRHEWILPDCAGKETTEQVKGIGASC